MYYLFLIKNMYCEGEDTLNFKDKICVSIFYISNYLQYICKYSIKPDYTYMYRYTNSYNDPKILRLLDNSRIFFILKYDHDML